MPVQRPVAIARCSDILRGSLCFIPDAFGGPLRASDDPTVGAYNPQVACFLRPCSCSSRTASRRNRHALDIDPSPPSSSLEFPLTNFLSLAPDPLQNSPSSLLCVRISSHADSRVWGESLDPYPQGV